jgi:hypothetical protein
LCLDAVDHTMIPTSQAVEHWSVVSVNCQKFSKHIQQALSPYHLLANIMHPNTGGHSLNEAELNTGMELASTQYGQIVWQALDECQSTGITIPEMHVF